MARGTAASAPTGKRAERSRRAIVAAAREVFLRDGFDASVDVVAATAGVSKVTVYNHFGCKEDLFTAVVEDALDEIGSTLSQVKADVLAAEDVREVLTRTARAMVAEAIEPPRPELRNLVTGELRRFPEIGRAWQERGPGRFAGLLGEILGHLTERGRLAVGDIEVATIQFFGLTVYPHLIFNSFGTTLTADLAERLIREGVDMFLRRYAT
ncbi:TetR/AcrR family transcriptional regulator [Nonomuraea sp. NPDC003804]|uniref:TetR/AcrR family transcriptional regulator n=1 Tax=Nonomuraea sp. NPDC003804 TaxID=3154547 RepID=UPI0033B6D89B